MNLNANDLPAIREIAREIVAEVGPDIAEKAARHVGEKLIEDHIKTCPMKLKFWKLVAAILASGVLGGSAAKMLPW